MTITDLVAAMRQGAPPTDRVAAITFDDGFASFLDDAWPELQRRSMSATLYVTTGTVGATSAWLDDVGCGTLPMLGWDDLRRLRDDGCDLGAHSVTHPPLDCIDRPTAADEIRRSRDDLADRLGLDVTTFAYPHGHHDRVTRQQVIDAGFEGACAVKNALSHADDDVFALARYTVTADMDADALRGVLDGTTAKVAPRRERLRTRAYRIVRRRQHRRRAASQV